jgi:hypothetical protein
MVKKVTSIGSFKGLMESDLNPKPESLLKEVRKTYQEHKIKERLAKAARKRRFLNTSAYILSVFTGLIVTLYFSGLLCC